MTTPPENPGDPWQSPPPSMSPEGSAPPPPPPGYGAPPGQWGGQPGYGQPPPGYGQPPAGYGAPPGYGQPPGYGYSPYGPQQSNGMATAALVLGIIGLLTFFFFLGGLLGVVAVILGIVARGKVKRGESNAGGQATAGIVLGGVAIAATAIWVAFIAANVDEFTNYAECLEQAQTQEERTDCERQFNRQFE